MFSRVYVSWIFLILQPKSSISWKIRNIFPSESVSFFLSFSWKVRYFFPKHFIVDFDIVLNMPRVLNIPVLWTYLSLNIKKFCFLKIRKAFLRKYLNFFPTRLFLGKNIRNLFREKVLGLWPKITGFHFLKYKKNFLLRKYKKFFNLRVSKFHFQKYEGFFSELIAFIFRAWF